MLAILTVQTRRNFLSGTEEGRKRGWRKKWKVCVRISRSETQKQAILVIKLRDSQKTYPRITNFWILIAVFSMDLIIAGAEIWGHLKQPCELQREVYLGSERRVAVIAVRLHAPALHCPTITEKGNTTGTARTALSINRLKSRTFWISLWPLTSRMVEVKLADCSWRLSSEQKAARCSQSWTAPCCKNGTVTLAAVTKFHQSSALKWCW